MSYAKKLIQRCDEHLQPENSSWPESLSDAAFYGLAGDIVKTIEPHTEADSAAILLQLLAFFGACVGRIPHYSVEGDKHFANIFIVLVGESSKGRKGTSMSRVRQVFEMINDDFARSCIQSGLSSGEGLIWAVRDENNEDAGVHDKRLLVAESEFAGLLKVMQRDGNIISRVVRDAWDRGDLSTMTKKFTNHATGAHISIVGHITADELRRHLDRTEAANGFANRFLFVAVRRARCLPFGGSLTEGDLEPLAKRLSDAIEMAGTIHNVEMDAEARVIWESVYPQLSEGGRGLHGAVTGRSEAQVVRLALLYALFDKSAFISPNHLKAALAIWDYADASARYVFGDAAGDPIKDTILMALQSRNEMSRTQISSLFARHVSSSQIDKALAEFEKAGRVTCESIETSGRPKEVWKCT